MPSLPNWLAGTAASAPVPGSSLSTVAYLPRVKDPNAPDNRLQITTKCVYERALPGGSYITTHVERLQSGYYDSPGIHEDCVKNVRFVALRFVFHEASTDRRFKSANIRVSVRDERNRPQGVPLPPQIDHPGNHASPTEPIREKPRFLRHAPHLLYGSISPETLDWNFNLAGSIGVSQAPVSASINPSGGVKSSYKVYKMMKIQGSIRTNASWYGQQYNIEDGEIVWTLEENSLQKSGLPREFTFVMMLSKGDEANDVRFEIDIEPEIASWFGHFPQWWVHLLKYQPLHKDPLNLDEEIGQKFQPCFSPLGFNFANLMSTFDEFVSLPGTTYGTHDPTGTTVASQGANPSSPQQQQKQAPALTQSPAPIDSGNQGTPSNTLHLRIHLDPSQQRAATISTNPSEAPAKPRRSPPVATTPSPKPALKNDPKPPNNTSPKSSRRVTINGSLPSNSQKGRPLRSRPLSTHQEESPNLSVKSKAGSDNNNHGADSDDYYEYAFPEPMKPNGINGTKSVPSSQYTSFSKNRPSKSTSTASSSLGIAPHPPATAPPVLPPSNPNPTGPPFLPPSAPSLRRTRSTGKPSLRTSTSFHSEPESEEAISHAMDMLSGSPPPPAPVPPPLQQPHRPHPLIPAAPTTKDDMSLATPRTRAALADLMEVERAEKARIERRNGNGLTSTMAETKPTRDATADSRAFVSRQLANRAEERERNRAKRYSMPVTSSGIGYPGSSAGVGGQDSSSGNESGGVGRTVRNGNVGAVAGNGRSSLMIPVGSKSDSGLGIGVATSTPNNADFATGASLNNYTRPVRDGSAGMRTAYEYLG